MSFKEFELGRDQFFNELRFDKSIAEEKRKEIKILFEEMMSFVGLVNSANHVIETKRKSRVTKTIGEALDRDADDFIEERRRPIEINIDDIIDIVFTVGITDDKDKFTALDEDIKALDNVKDELISTGDLSTEYFDDRIQESLDKIVNQNCTPEQFLHEVSVIFSVASDYMDRGIKLLRIADAENTIVDYLFDETLHNFKNLFRGRFSSELAIESGKWTGIKKREKIEAYFRQQSKINTLKFKILLIAGGKILGSEDPVKESEDIYQKIISQYNEFGWVKPDIQITKTES